MINSVVLGFFDGVHAGHRELINSAVNFSGVNKTILLTFKTSPSLYFNGIEEYIRTREKSVQIIKNLGVDVVEETDFSAIANQSAEDYLKNILQKYSPKAIYTGFNHSFGYNRTGNPKFLSEKSKELGFEYYCLEPYKIDNQIVSSTYIKKLLKEGNIKLANKLLVEPFSISGEVIRGNQIGRTIGFPTANINYPNSIVRIPFGVYSVNLTVENKLCQGIMNWGRKPTINNSSPVAEIHIIGFNGDLYGKNISVNVLDYIRSEEKFNSIEELKQQIEKDLACLRS